MAALKDNDLISIQEARDLLIKADKAFQVYKTFSQEKIDRIVAAMSAAGLEHADRLGEMAVEETGIGNVPDKKIKNRFAARNVYESIKHEKTIGFIGHDPVKQVSEVGMPVGIICGIIPTTNPTSTVIFKSLIALKAGNGIIFSPHPYARKSILATSNVMHEAAVTAGAPRGIIGCLKTLAMPGTKELMTHSLTALILATGGGDMVRAAYSSGKPALGVGPGNVPAYIHESADVEAAVDKIVQSKTFDNGTVCSSEQSIVADRSIASDVVRELKKQGAYFLDNSEASRLAENLITPQGAISGKFVGRSAETIAHAVNISVPQGTRVLVVRPCGIGPESPLSREKLSPVLGFYEVDGPEEGCTVCIRLLALGGAGHSLAIHARDESVIEEFALKKPVSRILVNSPSTHGAIGLTTGLTPSLTLGCGSMGRNATSDNITAKHLINIKRVARYLEPKPQLTPSPSPPSGKPEINYDRVREMVEATLRSIKG